MSKYRADTVKEHLRNGVLLRNPVLVQAIGLFPVVAVATSLTSALLFAVASAVILIIMEVFTNLVLKHLPPWLRIGFYAILSFIITIPFMILCSKFFADKLSPAAVFLPILSVNALISYRCERIAVGSSLKNSFWDAVTTSLGYGAVLLIVGFIRELLGKGSVFGYSIPNFPTISGLLMPFGGFIILGFMAAALKWGMARRYDYEATKTAVDHIREEEFEEKNGLKSLFGISKAAKTADAADKAKKQPAQTDSENKKQPKKTDKKAVNDKKAQLAAEKKQAEAERKSAQKAERQKSAAEKAAKFKAAKDEAVRLAEKKRQDVKKQKEAESARRAEEAKKREEAMKLAAENQQKEAEKRKDEQTPVKEKAKKLKKPSFFSAKPTAPKAESKPVSKTPPAVKTNYDDDDFDYDAVWEKYKSRQANRKNNNDKEEPKS